MDRVITVAPSTLKHPFVCISAPVRLPMIYAQINSIKVSLSCRRQCSECSDLDTGYDAVEGVEGLRLQVFN